MVQIEVVLRILSEAAVIVGVGWGLWLYSGMLKAKQATIDHLERLSAPALAEKIEKMAPVLDRLAADNEQLKEKQSQSSEASKKAVDYAFTLGIGQGMLEVILAVGKFTSRKVVVASLGGEAIPSYVDELDKLLDAELMPLAHGTFDGKKAELKNLNDALTKARRAQLKARD